MQTQMKTLCLALILVSAPMTALAQPKTLNGAEISALLPGIVALGVGEDTRQTFSASGQTEYIASGRPSVGKWWVTAAQYCSSWPPASGTACYDVVLDDSMTPARLIWVGESGTETPNTIIPKE